MKNTNTNTTVGFGDEKNTLTAKALLILTNEYEHVCELRNAVEVARHDLKCSSPAHTAISTYVDGQLDQLRSLIFAISGFDYQLIEDVEDEVDKAVSHMADALKRSGWPIDD